MKKIEALNPKPVMLLILDGWGYAPAWGGNAISLARSPYYNGLWKNFPHSILKAHGKYVGLPGHEMGNSEVGHLTIGAGRIIAQDSSRINQSIDDGSFFQNPVLLQTISHAKENRSALHLMGLLSDGLVHSHIDHLFALLDICQRQNFQNVFLHIFTDGRDTGQEEALSFISKLDQKLKDLKFGEIATVCGRYYAMDRDNHWERTQECYRALVEGKGITAESALSAVSGAYSRGITDEFIPPTIVLKDGKPTAKISSSDSVIFFNFRADRARQLSMTFMNESFNYFNRGKRVSHLFFVGMIPYGYEQERIDDLKPAFLPSKIKNTLAEIISNQKFRQLHIAETEKYAHVTYFFNGGVEKTLPLEERILIPSPRASSYDRKPEMSAPQITETVLEKIGSGKYNFIIGNFANPDMVGHSGNLKATVRSIEILDGFIEKISKKIFEAGGALLICGDHGNAEEMLNPSTGKIATEHNKNPVPLIMATQNNKFRKNLRGSGSIADIAPTILDLMGITKPMEMTGQSLFIMEGQNGYSEPKLADFEP